MREHPIEGLMTTAMDSIQDMVDVNTIIGEPIQAYNGIVIIPISKVSFGFAAGGSEFKGETLNEYTKSEKDEEIQYSLPFGGGSAAGVSINPVAFLVVQQNNVKLLPISHTSVLDKLLDYVPDLMEKVNGLINKGMQNKKEEKEDRRERVDKIVKEIKEDRVKDIQEPEAPSVTRAKIRKTKSRRPTTIVEYEYDETEGTQAEAGDDFGELEET